MDDIKSISKMKLFQLKRWLTIQEAANYLSIMFGEEVKKSDVLHLALGKELKLSVNFVNHTKARRGKITDCQEPKGVLPMPQMNLGKEFSEEGVNVLNLGKSRLAPYYKKIYLEGKSFIFEDSVSTIEGVWDLPLVGNEGLSVEQEYQRLTGGPEITITSLSGAFVEREEDGQLCQLQERLDKDELRQLEERFNADANTTYIYPPSEMENREYNHLDNYKPVGGLPDESVLVVRTQALIDFQECFSGEESSGAKSACFFDSDHPFHAKELKIAVEAWAELYEKNPPQHVPKGGHKKYITKWLEEKHPGLGQRALERISIVINPNPRGGASPI
jgi:hypothetical protein